MELHVIASAEQLGRAFRDLLVWANHVDVVQAWATSGGGSADHWKTLAEHADKLERVIVGVTFLQTEPAALRDLYDWSELRVIRQSAGTFHPKLVLGRRGAAGRALIGSANLTSGGFGPNTELGVLLEDDLSGDRMKAVLRFVDRQWRLCSPVTSEWLDQYEAAVKARAASEVPKAVPPPLPPRIPDALDDQEPPPDLASYDVVGGPFEDDLPLDLVQRRWAGEAPTVALVLGMVLADLAHWPWRHHEEGESPHVAELMRLGRGPFRDGEIWLAGGGLGGVAVATQPVGQPMRAAWDVPVGEWAVEGLTHARLLEAVSVQATEVQFRTRGGEVRTLAAASEPDAVVTKLGTGDWSKVGRLEMQQVQAIRRVLLTMKHPYGEVRLVGDRSGAALTGQYDDLEFRHDIGPPIGAQIDTPFPLMLLQDPSWLGGGADVLIHPEGLLALRLGAGLALVGACSVQEDIDLPQEALLVPANAHRLPSSPRVSFLALFAASAMWMCGTPGRRPCATFDVEDGFFEVADFNWPGDPTLHNFVLNLSIRGDLDDLQPRVDDVVRGGLEFDTWDLGPDGRTVEAVSFSLVSAKTPLEMCGQVHDALAIMWGRAPLFQEVGSIRWRYLMEQESSSPARHVRYPGRAT